jgi:hypothetical protein
MQEVLQKPPIMGQQKRSREREYRRQHYGSRMQFRPELFLDSVSPTNVASGTKKATFYDTSHATDLQNLPDDETHRPRGRCATTTVSR